MYATLTDRDVVRLPVDVRLDNAGTALVETDRDLRHELNTTAGVVLARVAETDGTSVADLVKTVTCAFDVDVATASADVKKLVTELNSQALVNLDGSLRARLRTGWVRDEFWAVLAGTPPTLPTVRTSASVPRLVAAMLSRLAAPLAIAIMLVMTVMSVGIVKFGAPDASDVLTVSAPLVVLLFFASSTIGHEVAHLLVVRLTNGHPLHVLAALGSARLVYQPRGRTSRAVAIAGPIAGLLTLGATMALVLWLFERSHVSFTLPMLLGLAAALPHLWSLLPWSADGRQIWARS